MHFRPKSAKLFEEAKKMFPGGVNSPVRAFKSVSGPPLFIDKGEGAYIEDVDGNKYLDFCGSWGPLILGHNHPHVRQKIINTVSKGTSFGTPTQLGNQLGKIILDNNPYIQKLRFVSSGTEAVMSAIRLARGYTHKSKIIKFEGCYHGHVDSLLVQAGSGLATFGTSTSKGIPPQFVEQTIVLPLNNLPVLQNTLEKHQNEIAAIIIEPIPANNGLLLQSQTFLESLRALCTQHNVLLIFDEVISGFRIGFTGASGYYNIQPDIITYGKIIGGGMPVGAYGASHEIMSHIAPDGGVYQAGTLSANPVTMSAGIATCQILLQDGFYSNLRQNTSFFIGQILEHIQSRGYPMRIPNIGSIFWLQFSDAKISRSEQIDPESMKYFKIIHGLLLKQGIYLGPSGYEVGFVSGAHTKSQLNQSAEVINKAIDQTFEKLATKI